MNSKTLSPSSIKQVFEFEENIVRVAGTPESPIFVTNDVCKILEIKNPRDAVGGFDPDDVDLTDTIDSMGRHQKVNCLTEPGLYRLIFRSNKPKARVFQRWVFTQVLPSIRKTGSYGNEAGVSFRELWYTVKSSAERLALLSAVGFHVPKMTRSAFNHPKTAGMQINPELIIEDLGELLASRSSDFIRIFPKRTDDHLWFELYFLPRIVVSHLRQINPNRYRGASLLDLRRSLRQRSEWIKGGRRHRVGPRRISYRCWGLTITQENKDLFRACEIHTGLIPPTRENPATQNPEFP